MASAGGGVDENTGVVPCQRRPSVGGCGLGKTLTALTHVYVSLMSISPSGRDPEFKLTLVVCPSGVLYAWAKEVQQRFGTGLTLYIFYGRSSTTADVTLKGYVVDDLKSLASTLRGLDPTDIRTARTIMLTGYSTWAQRMTKGEPGKDESDFEASDEKPANKPVQSSGDDKNADEDYMRSEFGHVPSFTQEIFYYSIKKAIVHYRERSGLLQSPIVPSEVDVNQSIEIILA